MTYTPLTRDQRIWKMRHEGYMTPAEIARTFRLTPKRIYTILWRQNQERGLIKQKNDGKNK